MYRAFVREAEDGNFMVMALLTLSTYVVRLIQISTLLSLFKCSPLLRDNFHLHSDRYPAQLQFVLAQAFLIVANMLLIIQRHRHIS